MLPEVHDPRPLEISHLGTDDQLFQDWSVGLQARAQGASSWRPGRPGDEVDTR
jgi:hypothetical protein